MDFNFAENAKVIPVAVPAQYSSSAACTVEWINMKHAKKATFLMYVGSVSTGSTAVTLGVAADAAGSKSTTTVSSMDLDLDYYYVSGATSASGSSVDTFTKTTVALSTFNLKTTHGSQLIVIEVDANKMGQFQSSSASVSTTYDADYVRLVHTAGGATDISIMCILTGLRYQDDAPPSALA